MIAPEWAPTRPETMPMNVLSSYVRDQWHTPAEGQRVIRSAVDGSEVAAVSTDGIDMAGVLDHARRVGGPNLRALTFHQRARILKALVGAVAGAKEHLYELSAQTGATKGDCWIDVDGGIGTMATYASKGRRELPDAHVVLARQVEHLSKDGSFLGVHVRTPREGVAVFINAFNFPVWGMLEKFAPAFLAGVPVVVKPATPAAQVAEAAVRAMVDSGELPDGALQFVCGSVGDMLDHLTGQDTVQFTGSAATATKLRGTDAIRANSVHFTAETDSLNSAILTLSDGADSPEIDLFVDEVVKELVAKSGQRCTCIRRAFVPESVLDEVVGRLKERVEALTVGDPTQKGTDIGPLVSTDQVQEVGKAVQQLRNGCEVVVDPDDFDLSGLPEDGAWFAPTVLLARDPDFAPVHEVEAFGPVTTVVPYRDTAHVVELAKKGGGSLVASVYAEDAATARDVVLGIAPYHGRVLVVDSTCAETQTGHGSPMPHLVHGGPGRAGGGEELGGVRAVYHHLQTTALQGSPDALVASSGEYLPGGTRDTDGPHPFKQHFEDLEIGDALVTDTRTVTLEDIESFAELTGDYFYAHMDDEAARQSPVFEGRVAHGYFLVSAAAGLFVWPDPGPVLANFGIDQLRFAKPVYPGDTIQVTLTCKRKTLHGSRGYGEVAWDTEVVNQEGEVVASYDVLTLVAIREGEVQA
jgi:oxepin-CoA hydrolase/3-oxo-5,6-dehydrosuberyl-CoA semialdehyde dehydrogenase